MTTAPSCGSRHPQALPIPKNLELDWDEPGVSIHQVPRGRRCRWRCRSGTAGAPGCGHTWEATLRRRLNYETGCPKCSNDWLHHPIPDRLRAEWRGDNPIDEARRVVSFPWVCQDCQYAWTATISHRLWKPGCPGCSARQRGVRRRVLAIPEHVRLDWAEEFSIEEANRRLAYRFVHRGSQRGEVPCGRSWSARLWARIKPKRPTGCPHCQRRKPRGHTRKRRTPEMSRIYFRSQDGGCWDTYFYGAPTRSPCGSG